MPDKIENVNGSVPAETENEGIGSGRVESGTEGVGERLSENAENESSVVADRAESGEKIDYESASLDEVMQNVEERLTLPDTDKKARTKKEHGKKWIAAILLIAFNAVALAVVLYLELNNDAEGFLHAGELVKVMGAHWEWLVLIVLAFLAHLASGCGFADLFRFDKAMRIRKPLRTFPQNVDTRLLLQQHHAVVVGGAAIPDGVPCKM